MIDPEQHLNEAGMLQEATKTRCTYRLLDNGIHEFVMLEFSRAGVDAFIAAIGEMNAVVPLGTSRLLLVDSSGGIQPLSYLFSRLRSTLQTRADEIPSPLALILSSYLMAGMIGGMMRIFPQLNLRIFRPDQRQAALDWLVSKTK